MERVRLEVAEGDRDAPKGYPMLGHVPQRELEQFQSHWQFELFVVPPPPGDDALTVPKHERR